MNHTAKFGANFLMNDMQGILNKYRMEWRDLKEIISPSELAYGMYYMMIGAITRIELREYINDKLGSYQ